MTTYTTTANPLSITCALCGRTSYSRNDVDNKYCGCCHIFHENLLPILTIYENPSDYPGKFVARMHAVSGGGLRVANTPLGICETLKEVQALVPPGAVKLMRNPEDDPCIVESWI
jgi:hypothetical protein